MRPHSFALAVLALSHRAAAQAPGSLLVMNSTLVSAMMMFVGNEEKVYILDKVEGNPTQIDGHPAWAAEWDIATSQATPMNMFTNVFCSSGMFFPNGSWATFGGNGAVKPGGDGASPFDPTYGDFDGSVSVRILDPCTSTGGCSWFDNATFTSLQKKRWYSTAEPLANGSIAVIGGFVNGGYINRNFPIVRPDTACGPGFTQPTLTECGASEPTYEIYPNTGTPATTMKFLTDTSGLNSYAHSFLMPSGKMFVQANLSTMLWDYDANTEERLQDMPNGVVRVYPASGAVAMLPLTPANNWTPTILFCGGSDMPPDGYGGYANPQFNTWEYPASKDCQRITPEPTDSSTPKYEQDDDMLDGRTMGQFIILPDGTLLVVNGGSNGTAGYATQTGQTANYTDMPFNMSLASGPVTTPAIYNPSAPAGKRWSNAGLSSSDIPRLYHSSALLMPDSSVMIAGSNPNVDYNITRIFKTEYRAEKFYPSYFAMGVQPSPTGIPKSLTYGGPSFDLTVPPSSYAGDSNSAAANTTVVLIRSGFTTHAMNMGQRMLQLNNTYSVGDDGTITLHVSQVPPNANLLTPGPAFMYVVVNGVPSVGKQVIIGSGKIEQQQLLSVPDLPLSSKSSKNPKGTALSKSVSTPSDGTGSSVSKGTIIGITVGGIVLAIVIAVAVGFCVRRRNAKAFIPTKYDRPPTQFIPIAPRIPGTGNNNSHLAAAANRSEASVIPLKPYNDSRTWDNELYTPNSSTPNFASATPTTKYRDDTDEVVDAYTFSYSDRTPNASYEDLHRQQQQQQQYVPQIRSPPPHQRPGARYV